MLNVTEKSSDASTNQLGNSEGAAMKKTVSKISVPFVHLHTYFITKGNWQPLFFSAVALTVIIGGIGLMYGFETVAFPFSQGLAGGLVIGVFTGAVVILIDPKGKLKPNTIWDATNMFINKLPPNGLRPILLSVAVTVILAAIVVFPPGMGCVLGIIMGNHLLVVLCIQKDLGVRTYNSPEDQIADLQLQISSMHKTIRELVQKQEGEDAPDTL